MPRSNRFYFPNKVGPAWQGEATTVHVEVDLEKIVDLSDTQDKKLLQISVNKCPQIMIKGVLEVFQTPEVIASEYLTILTIKSRSQREDDPYYNASNVSFFSISHSKL